MGFDRDRYQLPSLIKKADNYLFSPENNERVWWRRFIPRFRCIVNVWNMGRVPTPSTGRTLFKCNYDI